jgi:hypothetical protein
MLTMLGLEQNKVVTMEVKPHHPKMAPKARGHVWREMREVPAHKLDVSSRLR